ncbi:MAG: tetratricopeptide repeat protein, partial [Bacteroidales bacterium]|nr:tetratricopeptide repeat protein [Bacteroidales bacterium]
MSTIIDHSGIKKMVMLPVLLIAFSVVGQDAARYIDSITQRLDDRQKLEMLNEHTVEVRARNFALGSALADEALRLARKMKDEKLLALPILNKGTIYYLTGNLDSAQILWEDAMARFLANNDSVNWAHACLYMGRTYKAQADYDKSISYNQTALKVALEHHDTLATLRCLEGIATSYHKMGRYQEAYSYYKQTMEMNPNDKYTDIALGTLMNMGALCDDLDKIDEALERYTRALRIADSLQLPMRS